MRIPFALVGAAALLGGMLEARLVQAQQIQVPGRLQSGYQGVRPAMHPAPFVPACHETRTVMMRRSPNYNVYYYPNVPYNAGLPSPYDMSPPTATTTATAPPATDPSGSQGSASSMNSPSSRPQTVSTAPAEPPVRMKYVELSVSGLKVPADADKLTVTLDKLKGSRGTSVKRKDGGAATVKVWYSEKDPLEADDLIQAVAKLGYSATKAGS